MNPEKTPSHIYVGMSAKVFSHADPNRQSRRAGEGVAKCTRESAVQLHKHLSPTPKMPK